MPSDGKVRLLLGLFFLWTDDFLATNKFPWANCVPVLDTSTGYPYAYAHTRGTDIPGTSRTLLHQPTLLHQWVTCTVCTGLPRKFGNCEEFIIKIRKQEYPVQQLYPDSSGSTLLTVFYIRLIEWTQMSLGTIVVPITYG
jgi:hypothetical protein